MFEIWGARGGRSPVAGDRPRLRNRWTHFASARQKPWQATFSSFAAMHVPGEQSDAAHVQSTAAEQEAGRDSQVNVAGQPPMQPGCPVPGQLAVALDPAGQPPASGTGRHGGVPQFCRLTQTCAAEHVAASPHSDGASTPPSPD